MHTILNQTNLSKAELRDIHYSYDSEVYGLASNFIIYEAVALQYLINDQPQKALDELKKSRLQPIIPNFAKVLQGKAIEMLGDKESALQIYYEAIYSSFNPNIIELCRTLIIQSDISTIEAQLQH